MENLFASLIQSAPGLAVALAIVVIFVRHLKGKDDQTIDAYRESTNAIREVTKVMAEVTTTLRIRNGKGK